MSRLVIRRFIGVESGVYVCRICTAKFDFHGIVYHGRFDVNEDDKAEISFSDKSRETFFKAFSKRVNFYKIIENYLKKIEIAKDLDVDQRFKVFYKKKEKLESKFETFIKNEFFDLDFIIYLNKNFSATTVEVMMDVRVLGC